MDVYTATEEAFRRGYEMCMKKMNEVAGNVYPLTVVADRYDGAYSRGKFTAWNLDPEDVPVEINGDDVTCMLFWDDTHMICGVGDTLHQAIIDLKKQLENRGVA